MAIAKPTDRVYAKLCNAGRLTQELITAGLPQSPNIGFKFYGVSVDPNIPQTIVTVIDTLSPPDAIIVDDTVAAHVNTPLNTPATVENFIIEARLAWGSGTKVTVGTTGKTSRVRDGLDTYNITWDGTLGGDITILGAGGLDAGVPADNSWYAVHMIGDSRGVNTAKVLLSLSATAPTLPAGYDKFRRIGWARRNGTSSFLKFFQIGNGLIRKIYYDVDMGSLLVLSNGSAVVFTAVSLASLMAPGARECVLEVSFNNSGTGGVAADDVQIRPTGSIVASSPYRVQPGTILASPIQMFVSMISDENQSIDYQVSQGTNLVSIGVLGYTDEL